VGEAFKNLAGILKIVLFEAYGKPKSLGKIGMGLLFVELVVEIIAVRTLSIRRAPIG